MFVYLTFTCFIADIWENPQKKGLRIQKNSDWTILCLSKQPLIVSTMIKKSFVHTTETCLFQQKLLFKKNATRILLKENNMFISMGFTNIN